MDNTRVKVNCKNVFKNEDKDKISESLTSLWVEIINQLEKSKYLPDSDDSVKKNIEG